MNAVKTPDGLSSRRRRVFVVEDHELMRRSIISALEREANLTVCGEAENAQEAFVSIESLRPDLVLTDIELKSSSGLDLIKLLRGKHPALPIIATTMFDGRRNEELARAAGASAFISKSDGPEKLLATIQGMLRDAPNNK